MGALSCLAFSSLVSAVRRVRYFSSRIPSEFRTLEVTFFYTAYPHNI